MTSTVRIYRFDVFIQISPPDPISKLAHLLPPPKEYDTGVSTKVRITTPEAVAAPAATGFNWEEELVDLT